MDSKVNFILKVLFLSAGLAVVIKYIAPAWAIPATSTIALIAVLTPSVVMAAALTWRTRKSESARTEN